MIHVALNHWHHSEWLHVQVSYLHRFLPEPYRIVACLEDIPARDVPDIDMVVPGVGGDHVGKLNLLGHAILADATDAADPLVFLGPTVLPVARGWLELPDADTVLMSLADELLHPSVQPHPVFCRTTVGVWRDLPGDWARGYASMPERATATMPGANLLDRLVTTGTKWSAHAAGTPDPRRLPTLGLYGGVLYHHGLLVHRLAAEARGPEGEALRTRIWRGELLVDEALGSDPAPAG